MKACIWIVVVDTRGEGDRDEALISPTAFQTVKSSSLMMRMAKAFFFYRNFAPPRYLTPRLACVDERPKNGLPFGEFDNSPHSLISARD